VNLDELKLEIADARNQLRDEQYALKLLYNDVNAKKDKGQELKAKRDACNARVKELIQQAKLAQAKRDEINKKTGALKGERRQVSQAMRSRAREISKDKQVRRQFNIEAHGTEESIQRNAWGTLKTLLEMDLTLKNEAILFEMFFETKERLNARKAASKVHEKIQETYKDLKQTESKAQDIYENIGTLIMDSQKWHEESLKLFRQKDEVREEADKYHKELMENSAEIREMYKKVDAQKAVQNKAYKRVKSLESKLGDWKRRQKEKMELEKLTEAKRKADTGKKMGLDELKLLLDKGALKEK